MQGMDLNGRIDLSGVRTLKFAATAKFIFILTSVINVEVAKTNTNFLTNYQITYLHNSSYSYSRST